MGLARPSRARVLPCTGARSETAWTALGQRCADCGVLAAHPVAPGADHAENTRELGWHGT